MKEPTEQENTAPLFHLTVIRPDGKEIVQNFAAETVVVGRTEKCDLRLVDGMVSRNHCMIFREGKRHLVKDLESQNGTWVNGRRLRNRKTLKEGDSIQLGPFRLVFGAGEAREATVFKGKRNKHQVATDSYVHKTETEEVVKPLGIIRNYLSETTQDIEQFPESKRRERLNRNLLTLYRITEELVRKKDLDEILDHIMDQIFEIFSPSQATVLLSEGEEFPVPRKQRQAEGKGNERTISRTIVNRILSDRVGVLTDNALEDPRFEMGQSIIIDGIRSVMAAPIWEDRAILGVIYVDRLDLVNGYSPEDLDLLTAIGHQAALAIQRWNLTERLREEAVQNAVIRENLRRFHSPQVVDLILKGAADLEARETDATVFFCDIVSFTPLCESRSPETIQLVLRIFCEAVSEIVFEEQGTLDKFIGDAALAIYGAPLPQEDAAVRAVRSALKIRRRLAKALESLDPELRFRVRYGINTGNAVVGNFGSDQRMDYTILGHAVNIASRISKTAEPDQILVGLRTYDQIRDKSLFRLRSVGSRHLKGLKAEMKLFEVEDFV